MEQKTITKVVSVQKTSNGYSVTIPKPMAICLDLKQSDLMLVKLQGNTLSYTRI